MFFIAEGFGAGEAGLLVSIAAALLVALLTFNARDVISTQKSNVERLGKLEEKAAEAKGERLPHRVAALEGGHAELQGDMREIKGDVKRILSMMESNAHGGGGGPHQNRRATDPKDGD